MYVRHNKLILTLLLTTETHDFKFQSGGLFAVTVGVTGKTHVISYCVSLEVDQCYYFQIIWKLT